MKQSTAIDLARGLAAVVVAASHLRNHMLPDYKVVEHPHLWFKVVAFLTGFGGQAVIVFFVLSGWLVGGGLLSRSGSANSLTHYAIDRISRLWTVLIPVMLLNLAFEVSSPAMASQRYFEMMTFFLNLIGL